MEFITNKRILVIGAHSDDEVLGVGGTVLQASKLDSQVDVLIVTDSVSTQYESASIMGVRRVSHLTECCEILGVNSVTQWEYPDMKLDTIAHVDLNRKIENFLLERKYDTVFVHHRNDINKDHRILFDSVMVATRPVPSQTIKAIYCYYTPSSTEWGAHGGSSIFCPNMFVDVSNVLSKKLEALNKYKDELREYPHPRSIENVENVAKYFGAQVGLKAAEAFQIIRNIQN